MIVDVDRNDFTVPGQQSQGDAEGLIDRNRVQARPYAAQDMQAQRRVEGVGFEQLHGLQVLLAQLGMALQKARCGACTGW
jgi:hypothetical protein